MQSVSLSYTLWRNPLNRDDPANLAALPEELMHDLDTEAPRPLPQWLSEMRARMRYPLLWEAVRTTRVGIHPHSHRDSLTPESILLEHINYVLRNCFRDDRANSEFTAHVSDAVTIDEIEFASIVFDGTAIAGAGINTDRRVLGVAALLGDRVLSAVIAREHLPFITVEFRTR